MTESEPTADGRYGEGFRRGADWLYASGCIVRNDWEWFRLELPLEVLSDRYARHEITEEEFVRIRADLSGTTGGSG